MAVVNKFNVNKQQVTLDADIIENMSANDVSYNDSFQYDENTVGYKLSELESEVIYDVSAHNNGAVFESLSVLLNSSNLDTLIPMLVRHGGMSIRFIQGSVLNSDNKYVQYRLKAKIFSNIKSDWEEEIICTKVINNSTKYDLEISDEMGNILAIFEEGGIKTKNFNSKNVAPLLEKFKNKSIGIVGDSISTYKGWLPSDIEGYDGSTYQAFYPRSGVNNVEFTWWYILAKMLNIEPNKISNCSWSGSKITGNALSNESASAGCSNRRVTDLSARGFTPDIIICFISCNDWAYNVDIGTWVPSDEIVYTLRESYAVLLNKIHTNYPLSHIFVCTNLDDYNRDGDSTWPSNNSRGISTFEWNKNIIELADAFGYDVINLNKCGINYQNISSYFSIDNGLHPNIDGMKLIAQKAYNEIVAKY